MPAGDQLIRLKLPNGTPAELRFRGRRWSWTKAEDGVPVEEPPEAWLEYPLRDGLIAALRLLPTPAGELVVGEVRIFPGYARGRDAGRWNPKGEAIPPGGIPARVLREMSVPAGLLATRRVLRDFRDGWAKLGADPFAQGGPFSQVFTEAAADEPKRRGPGRRPLSEDQLVDVARRYVRLRSKGSASPTKDLAEEMRVAYSTAAQHVRKARAAGILTPTSAGKSGGALTSKGMALLEKKPRKGKR